VAELLAVENLSVGFHTDNGLAQVLDSTSLAIDAGEVVGLVGESGCGKTTLARAILGVLPTPPARIAGGVIRF
jgi:peptide/nickel transport system ATP-binding protein